jgi:hypothetical protein
VLTANATNQSPRALVSGIAVFKEIWSSNMRFVTHAPKKDSIMMPENKTRRAIIREWRSLPPEKRKTVEQACAFALTAIAKHDLQGSDAREQKVRAWLIPRAGKP